MNPEEPFVPLLPNTFPNRAASILVQELANHCLRDGVDDSRVRRHHSVRAWGNIRALVRR